MKSCAQSSWPISPDTTGTCFATGAICEFQHDSSTHCCPTYTWTEATSCRAGSFGRESSQPERSFDQLLPATRTGCFEPVERTASTSCCIPAARQPSEVTQPSRQQLHEILLGSL